MVRAALVPLSLVSLSLMAACSSADDTVNRPTSDMSSVSVPESGADPDDTLRDDTVDDDTVGDDTVGDDTVSLSADFDAVRVQVYDADGIACGLCLWRADTEAERRRGLMGVTDLEGAAGMAFVFDAPSSGGFWMKDTLIPLDVAFYDANGDFLDVDSMEPCPDGTVDCPVYGGATDYTLAIEVPAGLAAVYGMESGGRAVVDGPCVPTDVQPSGAAASDGPVRPTDGSGRDTTG